MRVVFWGVRGSYPIAYEDNIEYGGNTTSISVQGRGGELLMIDGGTGIRNLGKELMAKKGFDTGKGRGHLLFTHTHWDHILGLLTFSPFFIKGNVFDIYAARTECVSLKKVFEGLYDKDFFPVAFKELPARINLHEISPGREFTIGEFVISTTQLNHPNTTLGYRICDGESSFALLTDTAKIDVVTLGEGFISLDDPHYDAFVRMYKERVVDLARDADLLVYDTHFTEEDILGREHWGHSTPEDGIEMARLSNVRELILFHHNPDEKDREVDAKEREAQVKAKGMNFRVYAARDGMGIDLPSLEFVEGSLL